MRRPLAIAALVAAAAAPTAHAQDHGGHGAAGEETGVSIQFAAFDRLAVDVLAGDSVMWTNDSVRRHDVTADDGSWTSGNLIGGAMFARAFETPGTIAYHCSIHPFMRGAIGVHELLLARPEAPAAPRRPFTVRGRSALDAGEPITLEADTGGGFAPVATTTAGDDGTFAASFTPSAPAQLRAVGGDTASPPVQLLVLDRTVAASGRARHGRAVVRTRVLPASPGATVVLQLRLRERFGWWPVRRARLDRDSRAGFRVDVPRSVRARVVLTLADGATPLAVSPTLQLGRPHQSGSKHHHQ
jgi:plastocyanin